MMQPSRGSLSTGPAGGVSRIIAQENGLWNLRYRTQLDNETLGTPQGIFFTSIKNIQLNAFSFGQEGWSYFFPSLFHRKYLLGSWPHFFFFPAFYCLFLLPLVIHNACTSCLLTGWWKSPTLPLEMLITEERHNGFTGWCIGEASPGFWCLHFMGHLLSYFWNAFVLWRLHLT